jgi:adenylate cyclase
MAEERIERRLAAILAADVVGYSRLMEANEEGTLSALRRHRREVFDPAVARHGGRIFKTMGDGFLVEFASVLNAARCAVEIQRVMPARNAGLAEDRHIRFRIGLHVGDLIVEGDDFYGDGVNLAARLEGLAGPGGIACSAMVRQQIGNRLEVGFLDQGAKAVKNIAEPVHVFFVDLVPGSTPDRPATVGRPALPGEKPSVAILPFANMSNDPDQEFFSDGITEDIITDLAKVSGLFVLGRNTVFTYKGRAVNLEQVARELGVGYLVEGSVRKAGNRVRITAQLIEGATGGHVWAERYDRDLTDIFALQDEITQAIVAQLKVRLLPEEQAAIAQVPTTDIEAYTNYLRGMELYRMHTKSSLGRAMRLFDRAIDLDPGFARAYAGKANCMAFLKSVHGADFPIEDILSVTDRALALDPALADAYGARGQALGVVDRREEAAENFERALALDPNCFEAQLEYGRFLVFTGHPERSLPHYTRAMEIKPEDYQSPMMLSQALEILGRSEEVRDIARVGMRRAEEALRQHPENSHPAQLLATCLVFLGDRDRAMHWLRHAMEIDPGDNLMLYNAACAYALMGEADQAFDILERWLPQVAPDSRLWFETDPDLDGLRGHPRYLGLVALAR